MRKDPDIAAGEPPKPFANSYWVEPGRLLAGEYPGGSSRTDPTAAVKMLIRARVTCFIDLTQPQEMSPYDGLLDSAEVVYHRIPIVDHGVPRSPETIAALLAAIDAAHAQGRCIYLHCRAGIGRTGLAVGCYLIHRGLSSDQALQRLQVLWRHNARSAHWPQVPETEQQTNYVRHWRASSPMRSQNIDAAQRSEGAMVGLAIGDALAQSKAGPTGELVGGRLLNTAAQTAMTIAVAESLLTRKGHDAEDQLQRYQQWTRLPGASVPTELKRALATWQRSRRVLAGSHDPKNLDAHTLARTLAVVLFANRRPGVAIELAAEVSRVSLQSPLVLDTCRLWAALLADALAGASKAMVLSLRQGVQMQALRQRPLRDELDALLAGQWQSLTKSKDAVSAVATALLALQNTTTFQAGMLRALALAENSAVTAALYGSLAGALFGLRAIPEDWRRQLPNEAALRTLTQQLIGS